MKGPRYFHTARRSMRHKLGWYMAALAALLVAAVCIGLFSFGRISSPRAELARTLQTQLDFFRDDMRVLWQNVGTSAVHLSADMTDILEDQLARNATPFDRLTGNLKTLAAVEEAMLEPLCQYIRQTRCSGAFVILEASMRTDSAPDVRSGLYVQKNNAERSGNELLLFRGMADVGKAQDVMPHRKWQQEFRTAQFPNYVECLVASGDSLWDCCRITDLITLPGTSERAILLTVPLWSRDGRIYGICGFAVNQTYFCSHFEQPSDLSRLVCLLSADNGNSLDAATALITYTRDGSCTLPDGALSVKKQSGGLISVSGGDFDFVGKSEQVSLLQSDNRVHRLTVLIPGEDYRQEALGSAVQTALFAFLLLFFAVACCIYFARRYLQPVYADMKRLQSAAPDRGALSFEDFEPLTDAITAREATHRAQVDTLEGEKESLENRFAETQSQLEEVQADARQLATRRRDELDPAEYALFRSEYDKLTEKQRLVIDDMVDGLSPQESAEHLQYQKSTIYSYRRDIYEKLNINGKDKLQQLRLRVALLRQEQAPASPETPAQP